MIIAFKAARGKTLFTQAVNNNMTMRYHELISNPGGYRNVVAVTSPLADRSFFIVWIKTFPCRFVWLSVARI